MRWLLLRLLVILVVLFFIASLGSAGTELGAYSQPTPVVQSSASDELPPWEVRIGIPAWVPIITGNFGVGGTSSSVNLNLLENLPSLDALFVLSIDVRYKRWEIFGDGFYVKASDSVTVSRFPNASADLTLKTGFGQGFFGYRLINSSKGYLTLFSGARYNYMGGDFQISHLKVSGSKSWVDPVVGLKGKAHIWKPISLWAKGDVAGFNLNSGTAYSVNGGVEFQITRYIWLQTGWSYLKNDYSAGGFTNKTELSGPLVQLGVNF